LTPTDHATAFIAKQMAILTDNNGNPQELNPFSFLVADFSGMLHFGQML
jgi:hypothetical protein